AKPSQALSDASSVSVTTGGTATLKCQVNGVNVADYGGFWYHLRTGLVPRWVLVHWANGGIVRGTGYTDRFQPSRDAGTSSYVLTIRSIAGTDTGTYYCATQKDNQIIFGNGVHLFIASEYSLRGRQPQALGSCPHNPPGARCTVTRSPYPTRTSVYSSPVSLSHQELSVQFPDLPVPLGARCTVPRSPYP
ncbi:hypothetical protein chiPu_0031067, partial [Chiloscyllium punctatum]|nr:hypothetical protein [Chiloscyllium punctatum]